ncbi:MAG: hypothetical protein JRF40_00515 [Deltaproteobacteria bacterium]|nr:hypothetical protein [Deltaproteobacteria bacterium]
MSTVKNGGKINDLYNQIKNSELARALKKELLIVAKRGNQATRKVIQEFMNYLERHPNVRQWLGSAAIVGIILEMIPLSRFGILVIPGFVPGAVAGYMKGSRTDSTLQSTVVGGLVSWSLKPIITLSPIVGMLLVGFASGTLEELLAGAAREVSPEAAFD